MFKYALAQYLVARPKLELLVIKGFKFPETSMLPNDASEPLTILEIVPVPSPDPVIKLLKLYETSPCLIKMALFAETSRLIFLPTYGFIVKLSPLIDDKVFEYIFHDLLLELKLCKLINYYNTNIYFLYIY